MKTFSIKSLGCKQNQLEGQIIKNELIKAGYNFASDIEEADIFVLNSCTVTSSGDSTANYLLNQAKRKNPKIKTILTGCIAQTYKQHKDFNFKNADLILGNVEKIDILKYIDKLFLNEEKMFVKDIFEVKEFENKFLENPDNTRVSIKIQDGCNNRCSYCIIPYARGNSRSNKLENIVKQIEIVSSSGIKEIVLTGIHIGQWGKDIGKTFLELLKEIEKTSIYRYRLGSLYINELDDETISFLSDSKKFCPHFHLSLQSLCDKTLKAMNRNYTTEEALETIEKLHKNFDMPYLGSDIIVGFPDESDEDFTETYNNLKISKISKIHCFPYSKRENTPAYFMKNQIQDSIKTDRVNKIIDLSNHLYKTFLEQNKTRQEEILIQKKSDKTGLYSAVTRNYIKIHFKSEDDNLRHTIKNVNLSEYELE